MADVVDLPDLTSFDIKKIKTDLIISQRESYERRLVNAAKWAAELSQAVVATIDKKELQQTEDDEEFWEEYDAYMLAKSYFDLKEFDRAHHTLRHCNSPKPYFLRMYSLYMADQKKKADNLPDSNDRSEPLKNEILKTLQTDLAAKCSNNKAGLDGYGLYVYGVVLAKLDLKQMAIQILVEAVNKAPLNWAAWTELAKLVTDKEILRSLQLPNHWIKSLFLAKVFSELQLQEEAINIYRAFMRGGFCDSSYIVAQIAVTYNDMKDFVMAVATFQHLQVMDPYRIENMDTFSNLLFVQEKREELAHLAHKCCTVNKYCVETCCVIGNYYSLRSQHEKAILYFQRALKLNANYISAWTLMGHEYMELKNTSAAIQAYRRALEVDERDYRAWYGLGQTYEILKMPSYSLYYYRRAQALRPNDSRMVIPLGECYQKMDRLQEAKKCFWKAHCIGDVEEIALFKLANLFAILEEKDQACQAYTEYINQTDGVNSHNYEDLSRSYWYLANYHLEHKNWDEAYAAAQKCTEFAETREQAKGLLRTIQTRRGQEGPCAMTSMQLDTSIDGIAQTDQSNQGSPPRAFERVTPVNLKFTP
ncbi:cell division cycle protein 23 homolog [Plakobranchus ocellatus]|uniref:Cell division cycle protein 23 homolog n=1 Tax=Plakobranchus ocellatus TaxID=259542 RepID=A0AAV4CYL5_9GAST|nr:cell division cycle protein 23 homolog [Plakobranchus ocellatus]